MKNKHIKMEIVIKWIENSQQMDRNNHKMLEKQPQNLLTSVKSKPLKSLSK